MSKYLAVLMISVGMFLMSGCSTSSSTDTTTTTTSPTTTTLAQSIVLSGSLSSGSITGSGVKKYATAVPNYKIVALDNTANKVYYASSDASGEFSLVIPNGVSYEVSLVDENSKYFGPIIMSGNTASSEVIVGLQPSANLNLGAVVVDPSAKCAKPQLEPTAALNPSDAATATAGIPKGAGNCGKQEYSGITTKESGADLDKDGIPNIFDADEDNDGIRNGILISPTGATVSSQTVEAVFISSNIWATHGTDDAAKDMIAMWLNVTTPNDAALNKISSVQVIDAPASIKDVATIRVSSSIGSPVGYPAENSLWKDSSYHLYKTTTLSRNQYIVSLCPRAIMNVGDTFTVRVSFSDGSSQDFILSTYYVLTDWSRLLSYNGTTLTTSEGQKSTSQAAQFSTATLEVVISKAKDEDGNVLAGLGYSIIIGTCEADQSGVLPVPGNTMREYRSSDYPLAFTEGANSWTVSLDKLVTFEANNYYYISFIHYIFLQGC